MGARKKTLRIFLAVTVAALALLGFAACGRRQRAVVITDFDAPTGAYPPNIALVDNGKPPFHEDGPWDDLGNPSIAIDINPATGEPAIAYYAASAPEGHSPSAFFTQRSTDGSWSRPNRLTHFNTEPLGTCIGYQLDLAFDPSAFTEGDAESATPLIAATVTTYDSEGWNAVARVALFEGTCVADGEGWFWVDSGEGLAEPISWMTPVRLMMDIARSAEEGSRKIVNYVPASLCALMESDFPYGHPPRTQAVEAGSEFTGITHDFKFYRDDSLANSLGAVVYTQKAGGHYCLYYEVQQSDDYSWLGEKHFVATDASPSPTRHVAFDYFDEAVGIIWTTSDGDLYFLENMGEEWGPSSPELIATDAGSYADFEYEDYIGVRTIAYETVDWPWSIYVKCAFGDSEWSEPILVDNQVPGVRGNSHLDMVINDAYIYIAYSKNGDVYCRTMDFFRGNR